MHAIDVGYIKAARLHKLQTDSCEDESVKSWEVLSFKNTWLNEFKVLAQMSQPQQADLQRVSIIPQGVTSCPLSSIFSSGQQAVSCTYCSFS